MNILYMGAKSCDNAWYVFKSTGDWLAGEGNPRNAQRERQVDVRRSWKGF